MVPQQKPPVQPPPPICYTHTAGLGGSRNRRGLDSLTGQEGSTQCISTVMATGPGDPQGRPAVSEAGDWLSLCFSFYCFCPEPLLGGGAGLGRGGTPPTCLRPLSASLLSSLLQHLATLSPSESPAPTSGTFGGSL